MATYQALGTGPVSFVDANFNQQELPLGQIFYSPNGWDVTTAPLYTTANQPLIDALIKQLVAQGFVAPAATSLAQQSSAPQMTIKAAQAGAPGNSITVTFSAASLSQGTFTVTASATETFANLTPAKPTPTGSATTIDMVMGTSQATATGLVYVTEGTGLMPKAYTGGVGVVEDVNGGTAFTLVATNTTDAGRCRPDSGYGDAGNDYLYRGGYLGHAKPSYCTDLHNPISEWRTAFLSSGFQWTKRASSQRHCDSDRWGKCKWSQRSGAGFGQHLCLILNLFLFSAFLAKLCSALRHSSTDVGFFAGGQEIILSCSQYIVFQLPHPRVRFRSGRSLQFVRFAHVHLL